VAVGGRGFGVLYCLHRLRSDRGAPPGASIAELPSGVLADRVGVGPIILCGGGGE
jgi:hypothetical protein